MSRVGLRDAPPESLRRSISKLKSRLSGGGRCGCGGGDRAATCRSATTAAGRCNGDARDGSCPQQNIDHGVFAYLLRVFHARRSAGRQWPNISSQRGSGGQSQSEQS
jgi:hypothetical protein